MSIAISAPNALTMTSHDDQVAAFGPKQDVEPPDVQMAAGTTKLVEFLNNSGAIYDRATLARTAFFDLYALFAVPAGYRFTDPRLLYDPVFGRFVASGLAINPANNNSIVYILVSATGDPSGIWYRYTVPAPQNGTLYDQPKVGVSTDKVVVSWMDFTGSPLTFQRSQNWILSYTNMRSNTPTPTQFFTWTNRFSQVPAHQLTADNRQWITWNGGTVAGVERLSGDPLVTSVTSSWWTFSIPQTFNPPAAQQPGGTVDTGDDRSLSAALRNGKVWMTNGDQCTPPGDTVRACLRVTQFNVTGATPTMPQNFNIFSPGWYLYFPAVTVDGNNDVFWSYSRSNAGSYVFAQAANQLGTAPPFTVSGAVTFKTGEQTYVGSRWGDYCAGGPDPGADSNRVWVACQYAKASPNSLNWGTAAAQLAP